MINICFKLLHALQYAGYIKISEICIFYIFMRYLGITKQYNIKFNAAVL